MRIASLAMALAIGLSGTASAATLTGSFAAWQAGIGAAPVTTTATTGLFDPFALNLPTTSVIPLNDGQALALSSVAQVTQPQNGFPYALSDGFAGDLLIPQTAAGQATSATITPASGSLSAFGFEIVPFSSAVNGPYTFTVTLAGGQTLTEGEPGGDFNTGATTPGFFGYYGGPVASFTVATSDPNGFAIGNFVDVPEPASAMLLVSAVLGVACLARRRA